MKLREVDLRDKYRTVLFIKSASPRPCGIGEQHKAKRGEKQQRGAG